MKRALCAAIVAALPLAASPCAAQQQIEWKQTINLPKGLNIPKDVKVDILGIEPGDTYAEAKAKLERLMGEVATPPPPPPPNETKLQRLAREARNRSPLVETKAEFQLPVGGGFLTATYIGELKLTRRLPGSTTQGISEILIVPLSAPSSGHQVLGIERHLSYGNQADQPRVSELLASLKEKFRMQPQLFGDEGQGRYRFQFNNGRPFVPPNANSLSCRAQHRVNGASAVPGVNRTGDCDVVVEVYVTFGISKDHAKSIQFILGDNERAKANVGADFAFFDAYVRDLQARSKGAPPKL